MAKKKKIMVLARNGKTADDGLELNGKKMSFRGKSALWMKDEGEAREIQAKYGKNVAITEDQQYTWHSNNEQGNGTRMDNIHHYTFGSMKLPEWVWVRTDEGTVKQTRLDWAREFGWKILKRPPTETQKVAQGAEVQNGTNTI